MKRISVGPRLLTLKVALVCAIVFPLAFGAPPTRAQSYSVAYSFGGQAGGDDPYATLITDAKGNLYGTTIYGGDFGDGVVFEISAGGNESVLYSFGGQPADGIYPYGVLARDVHGNLYGTTYSGGANGDGTVFELSAGGTETVLHSFAGSDGINPGGNLVLDPAGNLYGTATFGGAFGYGVAFGLHPGGKLRVLHDFAGGLDDGAEPSAGLIRDSTGKFYGTTQGGGLYYGGTVFELTRTGVETVLYNFGASGSDGQTPTGSLVRDAAGNLYGTTCYGGSLSTACNVFGFEEGCGTIFKLSAAGTETVLYAFTGGADGATPNAGLVRDPKGNLYGTTTGGGSSGPGCVDDGLRICGVVFEIAPSGEESVLHTFTSSPDGWLPWGGLVFSSGALYGTTGDGGTYCCGTVFKITP